jgi:glyoxylase-like metal-dependent hydrolase (beta-lactamase superfamily II)
MKARLTKIYAGSYWSDGGALMGVLPWNLWHTKVETDEKRRVQMSLNLLLIETDERKILVDTGLGNRLNGKQHKIYNPSAFMLPASLGELGIIDKDITDVIMTHLHFDHAGGIISDIAGRDLLTFPRARYWIQAKEWEMAKDPDALNRAAYSFEHQLALLERKGDLMLVDGDTEICEGIFLKLTGGHTVGSQIVEITTDEGFYIYAGDIIATMLHVFAPITSAYDVSRMQTFDAKRYIYDKLREKQGYLLLDHDNEVWTIGIKDLNI